MAPSMSTALFLVFRCGGEYVFIEDDTKTMLTVTLSTTALNLFHRENMTPDEVARYAAEWTLLTHQPNGGTDLADSHNLSAFYRYCVHDKSLTKRAC